MAIRKGTLENMVEIEYFKGKKILITGHTGFKGAWITQVLLRAGADVTGYALPAPTRPSLFEMCGLKDDMHSEYGDIRDYDRLLALFRKTEPEFVLHLAAQPIVRESYRDPVGTYATNVMGTVHLMDCIRQTESVKSVLNVTTDKVYLNREDSRSYGEEDELNGYDPYSNSKSCSELVTSSYRKSFFSERDTAISTARAGNVIGGGDFAKDRIIPDCVRAVQEKKEIIVRNPNSVRPYQHVLEPVMAYLLILKEQASKPDLAGSYNIGPAETDCHTTEYIVSTFCEKWNRRSKQQITWHAESDGGPHESKHLMLNCSKMAERYGWKPRWTTETAIEKVVEWTDTWLSGEDVRSCLDAQINDYTSKSQE